MKHAAIVLFAALIVTLLIVSAQAADVGVGSGSFPTGM